MQDKKFLAIVVGIAIIFLISWVFVLSPMKNEIKKYKRQYNNKFSMVKKIHAQEYPPHESILVNLETEQTFLKKHIKTLYHNMNLNEEFPSPLNLTDFRKNLESKISLIHQYTNRLGVKFKNKLGFENTITKISKQHYIHLELAYYAIDKLVKLLDQESKNIQFGFIKHLSLQNTSKNNEYIIFPHIMHISLSVNLQLAMKWLHKLSQPAQKNNDIFFHIDKMTVKNSSNDFVNIDIVLSTASINLNGLKTKKTNEENTVKDGENDSLWRY